MTITADDVIAYIKYYAKQGNSSIYVNPADLALIPNDLDYYLQLRKEMGGARIVETDSNIRLDEKTLEHLGIRKKEWCGSLPTENVGKWVKTV